MRHAIWLLAAALLLTACSNQAAPAPVQRPALNYAQQDLAQAARVEYITMRGDTTGKLALAGPLWGDLNPTEVAHVLAVLRRAATVANPLADEPLGNTCWLAVHYRSGDETCVAFAYRKNGQNGLATTKPVHYLMTGRGEIASAELDQFLRGGVWRSFMPPYSALEIEPRETFPGELVTIHGRGFVGRGTTAVLDLIGADGKPMRLGEAPVTRGEFTWTGLLPQQVSIPPWRNVGISVQVGDVGGGSTITLKDRK